MSAATVRTVGRAPGSAGRAATARAASPRTAGTSRATTRPASRAATSRPAEGPRRAAALRLVPQVSSRVGRAPFIAVVVGLLALGLLGLLALNTSLAQNSFQLHALQAEAKVLADREQALRQEVEGLQAPEALAGKAEALGMVPGGPPAFLRLSDGKVLGKPVPAPAATALAALPGGASPVAPAPDAGTPTVSPTQPVVAAPVDVPAAPVDPATTAPGTNSPNAAERVTVRESETRSASRTPATATEEPAEETTGDEAADDEPQVVDDGMTGTDSDEPTDETSPEADR